MKRAGDKLGGGPEAATGQTLTEYILLLALFAVPISYYLFPKLLHTTWAMFQTLAQDLSGPGI